MSKIVQWVLGDGHLTSLIGYVAAMFQAHDGGTTWQSLLKAAAIALFGRLVSGGTLPGLPTSKTVMV